MYHSRYDINSCTFVLTVKTYLCPSYMASNFFFVKMSPHFEKPRKAQQTSTL